MLVAGPSERAPAAKSTRAELYGYGCNMYIEKCFRYLEAHSVTCDIVFQPLHPDTDAPVHAKTTMKRMVRRIYLSTVSQTEISSLLCLGLACE